MLVTVIGCVSGHGNLQIPTSWLDPNGLIGTRTTRQCNPACVLEGGGPMRSDCQCYWFTNDTFISGAATISRDSPLRTYKDILLANGRHKLEKVDDHDY